MTTTLFTNDMNGAEQEYYLGTTAKQPDCICIGSGRFLRSVLVPALNASGFRSAIFQTRGRNFLEYFLLQKQKQKQMDEDLPQKIVEEEEDETEEDEPEPSSDDNDNLASANLSTSPLYYEVDTVLYDGRVKTDKVACYGAGTLGTKEGKSHAMELLERMDTIRVIGVGVTEAGLASSSSKALQDLTDILQKCYELLSSNRLKCPNPRGRICVINTDNVPHNGDVIRSHVVDIAKRRLLQEGDGSKDGFIDFLDEGVGCGVTFHNTMVDRITSQREGSMGLVPRCEPVPLKTLVIEDLSMDLPTSMCSEQLRREYGVVVRADAQQLDGDIALKLRVANGTHTAASHAMALSSLPQTDCLSAGGSVGGSVLLQYLDALFESQILAGAEVTYGREETQAVYDDWRKRLLHPYFGLSSFFITQNGAAKGGIRITPTIRSLLLLGKRLNVSTAFSFAAILRYLTPSLNPVGHNREVHRGWLDGYVRGERKVVNPKAKVAYADGMHFNLEEGWYEFKTTCHVQQSSSNMKEPMLLCDVLGAYEDSEQPSVFEDVIRAYMVSGEGGDMEDLAYNDISRTSFDIFVRAVSTLYARMVAGDRTVDILKEMIGKRGVYVQGFESDCSVLLDAMVPEFSDDIPLHYRPGPVPDDSRLLSAAVGRSMETIAPVVFSEVSSALAIDLHTHLLPPSHGALCCWGIDELLTYHYLVAEYFMTAPVSMTPEGFYCKSKKEQADIIWRALFIDRSPVSEACRGVVTTLERLGLSDALRERDLDTVRAFYKTFRDDGLSGAERFSENVYSVAGIRYAVMTNIPFDANEAQHWRPKRKEYPQQYRSALRVDPLLAGDHEAIKAALTTSGYPFSIDGARRYLNDWVDTMKPDYMMASTPHDFALKEGGPLAGVKKTGVNEDAMQTPFAFADVTSSPECAVDCDGGEDGTASLIDENSDFLTEVLMKVCEERDLPLALKIGAHRGVNPELKTAGDGIVSFADASILARLCSRFPKVRFLATFLSMNNQHEACVLASKFRNLHIYGCWWYCNNPSLIGRITSMRVEMLGTSFTAQHSDARVLDQLIYKWAHSRAVIATVLTKEIVKLSKSGWTTTRSELRRDVRRLLGGSYEEFMSKSLTGTG